VVDHLDRLRVLAGLVEAAVLYLLDLEEVLPLLVVVVVAAPAVANQVAVVVVLAGLLV
jgi:hypothetical protein